MSARIIVTEGYAWCSGCKTEQPTGNFAKNRNRANGLQARCNTCRGAYNSTPKAQRLAQGRLLKDKYGITLDDYDKKLEAQQGLCAMCGEPETALSNSGKVKALAWDHCHKTGRDRSLLCQRCNIGLGHLDTVELLEAAIAYLKQNETATAIA